MRPNIKVPRRQKDTFWSQCVLFITPLVLTLKRHTRSLFTLLFLLRATIILFIQWRTLQFPYEHMRVFAANEATKLLPKASKPDWNFEEYEIFSKSTCIHSASVDLLRERLRGGLLSIPTEIRTEIIARAVVQQTNNTDSMQNIVDNALEEGVVFAYMAYWSTAYSPGGRMVASEKYLTCVMVVGISLSTKSDLAGFQPESKSRVVGTEPCRCGILSCAACPIFEKVETRLPIYNQRKLPPEAQQGLHEWMVASAMEGAHEILETRPTLGLNKRMEPQMVAFDVRRLQWQPNASSKSREDGLENEQEHSKNDL